MFSVFNLNFRVYACELRLFEPQLNVNKNYAQEVYQKYEMGYYSQPEIHFNKNFKKWQTSDTYQPVLKKSWTIVEFFLRYSPDRISER